MPKEESHFNGQSYQGYKLTLSREGTEKYAPYRISGPEDAYNFMKDIEHHDRERFYAIHLDSQNHVIGVDEVGVGTLTLSLLHPREVFKSAIINSAAAIIIAHNHPSGEIIPSAEDIQVAKQLYECGELLGIEVFDSLIIGHDQYYSAKEVGEL